MTNGDELRVLNRTGYFIVITPLNTTAFDKKEGGFPLLYSSRKSPLFPQIYSMKSLWENQKIEKWCIVIVPSRKIPNFNASIL